MSSLDLYRQQMKLRARRRSEINRHDQLMDRVLVLLRQEWEAGASNSPGFHHHQQRALLRAQVAAALNMDFEQGDDNA